MVPGPDRIRELHNQEDAEANAIIGALAERDGLPGVMDLLDRLVTWRPEREATPSDDEHVKAWFERTPEWPTWFDNGGGYPRLRAGQKIFNSLGYEGLLVLAAASLPQCYVNPNVAATLMVSGRIVQEVRQRLLETADFVLAVTQPGSLEEGEDGHLWIRKVRLMHACMRYLMRTEPRTVPDRWGNSLADELLKRPVQQADKVPIDAVELAYVLQTFCHAVLAAWRQLGIKLTAEEKEDYCFAWCTTGALLGIHPELLPEPPDSPRAAEELFDGISQADVASSGAGCHLAAAIRVLLTEIIHERFAPRLAGLKRNRLFGWLHRSVEAALHSLPRSLIRKLIGKERAHMLWIDRAPFVHWVIHCLLFQAMRSASLRKHMGLESPPAAPKQRRLRTSVGWRHLSGGFKDWWQESWHGMHGCKPPRTIQR